jgi:hypothetical protein
MSVRVRELWKGPVGAWFREMKEFESLRKYMEQELGFGLSDIERVTAILPKGEGRRH